jgi:hypothetical protein
MNDKKKPVAQKLVPEHTIRVNDIVVYVHQRRSHSGFVYWDYTLARTWRSQSTNNDLYGESFFVGNQVDLVQAISEACDWIRNRTIEPQVATSAAQVVRTGE